MELGWLKLAEWQPPGLPVADDQEEALDDWFGTLFFKYCKDARTLIESTEHLGRFVLTSDAYISDLEDVLRYGLILFDKIAVEPGPDSPACVVDNCWTDGDVWCNTSFFSRQAIRNLSEHFGDILAGHELVLLPRFGVEWSEADEEAGLQGSDPWAVRAVLGPLSEVWSELGRAEPLRFESSGRRLARESDFPFLVGGDVRELVRLRREEEESLRRWRTYLDQVLSSNHPRATEVFGAVEQGLAELKSHLGSLKRMGVLDAPKVTLTTASVGVAMATGGPYAAVAGALGLGAAAADALRSYFEMSKGRREIRGDRVYFLWLIGKDV